MKRKIKKRLLPSDFQKYLSLKKTKKKLKKETTFFTIPDDLKGDTDLKVKPFLVFYFDSEEEYKAVRNAFELKSGMKSHPHLDSHKLYQLIGGEDD